MAYGGTLKVSKSTRWSQNLPQGNQKVLRVPSYGQRVIWDPTCSIWFNLRSSCIFKHKRHSWWIYAAWSTAISVCYRTCKGKKPSSLYGRAGLFALCVISCHEIRSWCLEMSTLSVSPPCQLLIVTILEGWPGHIHCTKWCKKCSVLLYLNTKKFSLPGTNLHSVTCNFYAWPQTHKWRPFQLRFEKLLHRVCIQNRFINFPPQSWLKPNLNDSISAISPTPF